LADSSTDASTTSNPFSTLGSLFGTGLGFYGANQSYGLLQNALNTIGPTQLGNFGLTGPAGGGSYNLQNGTGSLDFGSLNPAFAGLSSAAASGAGMYSPDLLNTLTQSSYGQLNPALGNLNSAYGLNNLYQGAGALQAGGLGQTYNSIYGNTLANMRAQAAPAIQQQAYGLQNTLFGNGVADSTGGASGSLAAANFGRGVAQGDATMQLNAQQAALQGMQTQSGIANQLSGTGSSLLSNAFNQFGNTNQLISGLNTASLNNALSATQGAGAINTLGLNNYNSGLQTQLAAANARNGSLFPYAMVSQALAGKPNAATSLGTDLSANGGSLLSSLFGGGGNPNILQTLLGAGRGIANMFSGNSGNGVDAFGMPMGAATTPQAAWAAPI